MQEFIERPQLLRYRTVTWTLTTLFVLFVLFFVILFQCDLIALIQETLSHGQTTNNPIVTAIIVSALLVLLQRGINAIARLRGRWEGFSWMPSFMILSMLTSVDSQTLHFAHPIRWAVTGVVVIACLIGADMLQSLWSSDKKTPLVQLLFPSLAVFAVSIVFCMQFTNHDAPFHQELAAYHYAERGDVEKVARLSQRSLETTPALTAMRNVALARIDRVGDDLFFTPQPYGSEGLCVPRFAHPGTHFGIDTYSTFIGYTPYGGENASAFAERLYRTDDNPFTRNMQMASLLLDCRTAKFATLFPPSLYVDASTPAADIASVPIHFREAWLLCATLHPETAPSYTDTELQPLLDEFLSIWRNSHTDARTTLGTLLLRFPHTYWYHCALNGAL